MCIIYTYHKFYAEIYRNLDFNPIGSLHYPKLKCESLAWNQIFIFTKLKLSQSKLIENFGQWLNWMINTING